MDWNDCWASEGKLAHSVPLLQLATLCLLVPKKFSFFFFLLSSHTDQFWQPDIFLKIRMWAKVPRRTIKSVVCYKNQHDLCVIVWRGMVGCSVYYTNTSICYTCMLMWSVCVWFLDWEWLCHGFSLLIFYVCVCMLFHFHRPDPEEWKQLYWKQLNNNSNYPGLLNRWKSIIGDPIDQLMAIDKH